MITGTVFATVGAVIDLMSLSNNAGAILAVTGIVFEIVGFALFT
jgi:hypothetical protein